MKPALHDTKTRLPQRIEHVNTCKICKSIKIIIKHVKIHINLTTCTGSVD